MNPVTSNLRSEKNKTKTKYLEFLKEQIARVNGFRNDNSKQYKLNFFRKSSQLMMF